MARRRFRVATVIGARPQFIKAAPVSRLLRGSVDELLIHTGQHYDWEMSGRFFRDLGIPKPSINLGVGSGSHAEQTAKMMVGIERFLMRRGPDLVLVYGDTNSTVAAALTAGKLHIPIAHVEAGMRSFDRAMPEELNRIVTDHLASLLFCPSETSAKNLRAEGIVKNVYNVGDNMLDVFYQNLPKARRAGILRTLKLEPHRYHLTTLHRPANTDGRTALASVLRALKGIAEPIVFPIHPRTATALRRFRLLGQLQRLKNVQTIKPVGYIEMLALMMNAKTILTDSGGVQKEAFSLKVPCITIRDNTEWTETVSSGWNTLTGNNENAIVRAVRLAKRPKHHRFVYGRGHASEKIVHHLLSFLLRNAD